MHPTVAKLMEAARLLAQTPAWAQAMEKRGLTRRPTVALPAACDRPLPRPALALIATRLPPSA